MSLGDLSRYLSSPPLKDPHHATLLALRIITKGDYKTPSVQPTAYLNFLLEAPIELVVSGEPLNVLPLDVSMVAVLSAVPISANLLYDRLEIRDPLVALQLLKMNVPFALKLGISFLTHIQADLCVSSLLFKFPLVPTQKGQRRLTFVLHDIRKHSRLPPGMSTP